MEPVCVHFGLYAGELLDFGARILELKPLSLEPLLLAVLLQKVDNAHPVVDAGVVLRLKFQISLAKLLPLIHNALVCIEHHWASPVEAHSTAGGILFSTALGQIELQTIIKIEQLCFLLAVSSPVPGSGRWSIFLSLNKSSILLLPNNH